MEARPLPSQINLPLVEADVSPRPAELPAPPRLRRERSAPPPAPPRVVRTLRHRWYLSCKSGLDFVLAACLSVVALPLIGLAALAVRLTSSGPAFYSQTRMGRNGRPFTIWKLRTMIHNCESLTGPRWSIPGDPRITAVGWFLRRSHLDELPQLLNVLRGEMSLIGPRPERPEFVPELERAIPAYGQRLLVKPGVTGLAQVQLPPDTDLASVRRKLACDLYYIERLSPWLDLKLMLSTGFYAAGVPFRLFRRLLGLPPTAEVQQALADVVNVPAPQRPRLAA
jgi:lipopolysaccharide/colanic/teichoic acid biosynthesis glycosyltransferase